MANVKISQLPSGQAIAAASGTISIANVSTINGGTISGNNTGDQTIALTGDVTGSGTGSFATAIGANKVTNSMIRQSGALSIIGNSSNATANVADISASLDGQVLSRSGTAIGFGAVNLASTNAVTGILPNANTTATSSNTPSTIVTRDINGSFNAQDLTGNNLTALNNVVSVNNLVDRFSMPTHLGSPLTVGDLVNYTGGYVQLADAATGLQAHALYNSDVGGSTFVVDSFATGSSINAIIGDVGYPVFLAAGGGQPVLNRVTQPGYIDQCVGYSWGGYGEILFMPFPYQVIPASLLLAATPDSLYTPLFNGGYTGSATNVTQANDFGVNAVNAAKVGTGNILLTQTNNQIIGFDFGTSSTDRGFDLGTASIGNYISGNAFTVMTIVKPTSTNNGSVLGWENNFDTFYLDINGNTGTVIGTLAHNVTFGQITGTTSSFVNKTKIVTWTRDSSFNSSLYINSKRVATASLTAVPSGNATVSYIGKSASNGPFQGITALIAFWKRTISEAERLTIESQLITQFGIS